MHGTGSSPGERRIGSIFISSFLFTENIKSIVRIKLAFKFQVGSCRVSLLHKIKRRGKGFQTNITSITGVYALPADSMSPVLILVGKPPRSISIVGSLEWAWLSPWLLDRAGDMGFVDKRPVTHSIPSVIPAKVNPVTPVTKAKDIHCKGKATTGIARCLTLGSISVKLRLICQ